MASGDQYGPALPPGMVISNESASGSTEEVSTQKRRGKVLGPQLPPGMQKSSDSDDLSDEGQLTVKMESEMSPEYSIHDDDDEDDDEEEEEEEVKSQNSRTIGPLPSEMNQGREDVVHATEEFERRSKRMKDKLTIKAEAEEGPSKREEWMTELPPEMGKNFGLQSRTFSKGAGHSEESKDRSSWTETPSTKKDKDNSKGKKRKRDDDTVVSARDDQLHHQVEDYNKTKRPDSLMDMHSKKLKKKKAPVASAAVTSTPADSTQAAATTTTIAVVPGNQAGVVAVQGPQHIQQYYQLSDEIRDSLDLLSEQKNTEFYGSEFNSGEFNEAKPLADLLMNPNMVSYSQEGNAYSQAQPVFSTSQMIAQAYSHAQQMSAPVFSQVVSSSNGFPQGLPTQVAGNITVVNSNQGQDVTVNQNSQQQTQTIDVGGQQVQTQIVNQAQMTSQQVQSYAEAYAAQKKEKKEKKKRKEKGGKDEKEVRRPFDRDKDLSANVFDDAQRKAIIKKSQMLDTRFSHSTTTSHFL